MTEIKIDLIQEIEDFVQLQLDEWLLDNPEPEQIIDEKPDMPKSELLTVAGGFFVMEVCGNHAIRLHVTVPQRRALFIDIGQNELGRFIEQLLILEADMQTVRNWMGENGQKSELLNKWRSMRGQIASEARRNFVKLREDCNCIDDCE